MRDGGRLDQDFLRERTTGFDAVWRVAAAGRADHRGVRLDHAGAGAEVACLQDPTGGRYRKLVLRAAR